MAAKYNQITSSTPAIAFVSDFHRLDPLVPLVGSRSFAIHCIARATVSRQSGPAGKDNSYAEANATI